MNQGMEKTLDTEPDHFFYYNNGITIVCDAAERVSHSRRFIGSLRESTGVVARIVDRAAGVVQRSA